jgi:hypothetical protein
VSGPHDDIPGPPDSRSHLGTVHEHLTRHDRVLQRIDDALWALTSAVNQLSRQVRDLHRQEQRTMTFLTELAADVQANTDATTAVAQVITTILDELENAAGDPAAQQAILTQIRGNTAGLVAAALAGTPVNPAPE